MRNLSLFVIACVAQAVFPGSMRAQQPRTALPLAYSWSVAEPAPAGASVLAANALASGSVANASLPNLVAITPLPRMAPELALATFEQRQERQPQALGGYSATQVIDADLPDSRQKGEWELLRRFVAPRTLEFKPLRFIGDNFVKTNVIARLLKSEVEHVEKGDPGSTALSASNYKFKYKGVDELDGRPAHVFEVKPRKKRPGLIKGRIYLDVRTGALLRVAGELVKSPSFFVKKLEFVQDYADFGGFTLPVHTRSTAKTRIVGRAVVEITTRDYAPIAAPESSAALPGKPVSLAAGGTD
jgi:hypothetical protein